jgi:hypothetical protein
VFVATARADDVTEWCPEDLKAWNVQGGGFTEATAKNS